MLNVIWTLLFTNCTNNKVTICNKNTVVYKITKTSDEFFQWNGIIENIESIPLETRNNSLIGQLTKGVIDKSGIYLLDFKNQCLLNFDKRGKFIRKIGQRGKGPNEFLEVRDFCISNNNLYTLDYKKILCYNLIDGDVIDSWSFNSEKGFNPENLIVYSNDEYYLWNSNPDVWDRSKGEYFRMRKIRKDKIDSEYFKYTYKTSGDPRFYACGNGSYYLKPVDGEYVIHKLTKDSLYTSFEIDFGNRALIPEEINELRNSNIPNAYLKSNFFKSISNILEVKDYIYFNCIGPGSKKYEGLINKKTAEIKFGRWDYKRSPRFFYTDGELLYGYYEPYTLMEELNSNNELNTCFDLMRKNLPDIQVSDNLILVTVNLK